jgi:hypothetical protein
VRKEEVGIERARARVRARVRARGRFQGKGEISLRQRWRQSQSKSLEFHSSPSAGLQGTHTRNSFVLSPPWQERVFR